MSRSKTALLLAKHGLPYLALALAVAMAVPILALLLLSVRLVIPVLLAVWTVTLAVSPSCRRRLAGALGDKPSW